MSYTTKEFITTKMERDFIPYFQIKDSTQKLLLEENNSEKDSEKASKLFLDCINSLEGDSVFVRIADKQFRGEDAQGGALKAGCFSYSVRLQELTKNNNNHYNNDNSNFQKQLDRLEIENKTLRDEQLQRLENERESKISGLEQKIIELESNKSEINPLFEHLIMHIGNAVISSNPQILNNSPKGINDNLDNNTMATNNLTDSEILARLNKAIGILSQHDANYLQNIERLAIVVVKKPKAYKQAVGMLKMMC